ncbi:MAG: GDP-mannose 4,6-dehydratase [Micavibrio aeruginosavorus]|uniref:GDP-mannose 4,6-dehydratase n=1 Tax=Micavibrio aeruginosavorus TaxID=349221 RepID=A0A7T5R3L2_9BACT|nr:MAG: GDP-mannose 4,6-dehydratase [Micavibrio aeruginosavorus]
MAKTALITGITGQDGAYLAALLLEKGYHVHGVRLYEPSPLSPAIVRLLEGCPQRFFLHYGDMVDGGVWLRLLREIVPDEIYNLAALSHVGVSFELPEASAQINALGTLRLLEAVRSLRLPARLYQASSSEMFGNAPAPQNEETPFQPCSPYASSKLYAYWLVRNYREAYGVYAGNGILFNHESPLRGEEFVTRKITRALAEIVAGKDTVLRLGNLDAQRDWGHASDYVEGMWRMLQQPQADDYVLATGHTHAVREFVKEAFSYAGIDLAWRGQGTEEEAFCARSGRVMVSVDPSLFRPSDIRCLRGDAAKARNVLGWEPRHDFLSLVRDMVDADLMERGLQRGAGWLYAVAAE